MQETPFKLSPSIKIFTSINVYVKFVGGTFQLFKDEEMHHEYPPHPDFEIPCQEQCAFYFYLTSDSDSGAVFPDDPFEWLKADGSPTTRPASVSYEKRTPDNKSFSIRDDNMASHTQDYKHKFKLLVADNHGQVHKYGRELFAYDPTLVEKGEEEGKEEER